MGDGTGESAAEREEHRAAPGRWTGADIAALVGLTALAALLRLLFVEQWSYGPTEGETWRLVSSPLADSLAAEDARSHPLYYLLLRQLLEQGVLAGATEGWLRLPSVFAGCLTAPLVALAARPLLGRAAAMLAALVVAVHPACVEVGQTAAPAAFATLFAVLAGALVGRGWRTAGVAAAALAGGCHPIGWVAELGMMLANAAPAWLSRAPRALLAALLAAAAPLVLARGDGSTWALAGLAALAFGVPFPRRPGFAAAALLPLAVGGVAWWCGWRWPAVGDAALALSAPALAMLASWTCVGFGRAVVSELDVRRPLRRLLAAAPAVILLGELWSGSFLYFFVYDGGRSAWRAARSAVASVRAPGQDLVVYAGRGVDVLRTYLRPSHWSAGDRDAHPGVVVEPLAADADAQRHQLAAEGALVVLQRDELALVDEQRADLEVVTLWEGAQAVGDGSLYVLRRRAVD